MYRQHPGCKLTVWRYVPDYGYQTFNVLALNVYFSEGSLEVFFLIFYDRDNQTGVTHFRCGALKGVRMED